MDWILYKRLWVITANFLLVMPSASANVFVPGWNKECFMNIQIIRVDLF